MMYFSYYLFGKSNKNPIWKWENWKKVIPFIQPIIELSPENPLINTNQYSKGLPVKFNKMIWNLKNNEKWTTQYADNDWEFFDTEIASPSRNACQKNRLDPLVLIMIQNCNLTGDDNVNTDQSMSIHIATHLIDETALSEVEKNIDAIAKMLNYAIAGKIQRPVAFPSKYGMGYGDSIWLGSHGVLNADNTEFSDTFKGYGITKIAASEDCSGIGFQSV